MHHLLPNKFKDFFQSKGLNVENFKTPLDKAAHRLLHDGIHTGSNNWNKVWDNFIARNPITTQEQILKQLELMKNAFGIK